MKHEKKTLEETVQLSLAEAEEALKHPFVFKKPIKNVAVIGAGPSGVSDFLKGREIMYEVTNPFFFV